jgi:hypothetical protein
MNSQATLLRILRILRVLRIIRRFQKLQIIFETIMDSLPSMLSLGGLLLLFLVLFSIVGMQVFPFVRMDGELNKHVNFQHFT